MLSFRLGLRFQRVITGLCVFWTLAGVGFAHASPICKAYLSLDDYRSGTHITLDADLSVESRKPEANSLEARKPGIAKAIVAVMNGRMPFFRWPHAGRMTDGEFAETINEFLHVNRDLLALPEKFALNTSDRERFDSIANINRSQIESIANNYSSFHLTSHKIANLELLARLIQSSLFELLVSTFIDGEKFWFHQDILKFYRGQRLSSSGNPRRHLGEHEIDIIVRQKDGSDLWVEVKNNAMDWSLEDYAGWAKIPSDQVPQNVLDVFEEQRRSRNYGLRKLTEQLIAQVHTKTRLANAANIELLLVSKYPFPSDIQEELREDGITTWPLYHSAQAFLPQFFQSISKQNN